MRISRRIQRPFIAFWLGMGLIFSIYAQFFVDWKEGMFIWFAAGCLGAGACIRIINFWLINRLLMPHLQKVADVSLFIVNKVLTQRCIIESRDTIGNIIQNMNAMADNLQSSFNRTQQITQSCSETIEHLDTKATLSAMKSLHELASSINQQTYKPRSITYITISRLSAKLRDNPINLGSLLELMGFKIPCLPFSRSLNCVR